MRSRASHRGVEVLESVLGSGARLRTDTGPETMDVGNDRVAAWVCSECIPLEVGSTALMVLSTSSCEVLFAMTSKRLPWGAFARELAEPQAGLESASLRPLASDTEPLNALLTTGIEVDPANMQVLVEEEEMTIRGLADRILEHYGDRWTPGEER